jgi:molybdopterin adenylyltransferase
MSIPPKRLIRVGILCVPALDESAITTLFRALHAAYPPALLVMTTSALNQQNWVEEILRTWCDIEELDLVLTVGGTLPASGPSAHEIVPNATRVIVERVVPGLAEAMRYHAQQESALAWLDCGIVGIRGRSLVVNLPAGAAPALLFLEAIIDLLPIALAHLHGDSTAPQLLDEVIIEQADTVEEAPIASNASTGLRADEFAAFLARNKP